MKISILLENKFFGTKIKFLFCAFFQKNAQRQISVLKMKNQFSFKILISSVFSSRFYVEKHVLSLKKDKIFSKKLKITEKMRSFLPPACPRDPTSHPYAFGFGVLLA